MVMLDDVAADWARPDGTCGVAASPAGTVRTEMPKASAITAIEAVARRNSELTVTPGEDGMGVTEVVW